MTAKKTHLLWDHDGVLVDTERLYFEATRRVFDTFGVTLSRSTYLQRMTDGLSCWPLLAEQIAAPDIASGELERELQTTKNERNQIYAELLQTEAIEIPNAKEILTRLAARYEMAVVTSARREDLALIHRNRTLLDSMCFVVAQGDYHEGKPQPEPYMVALGRFDIAASQAVAIEDSKRGLNTAVAAGIDCVVVQSEFTRDQDFSQAAAVIDDLSALDAALDAIELSQRTRSLDS